MPLVRSVLDVTDDGTLFRVNAVTTINKSFVDMGRTFINVSGVAEKAVSEFLADGYTVHIPKDLGEREVLVGNLITSKSDDPVFVHRRLQQARIRTMFANAMVGMHAFDFFGMFAICGKLMGKGYTITDPTRQEVYVEILSKDDPDLMSLLQEYIDVYKRVNDHYDQYKRTLSAIDSIEDADSIDEIDQIYSDHYVA